MKNNVPAVWQSFYLEFDHFGGGGAFGKENFANLKNVTSLSKKPSIVTHSSGLVATLLLMVPLRSFKKTNIVKMVSEIDSPFVKCIIFR